MNEPFDLYGTGDEKGFRTDPQDAVNEPSAPDHNAVQEEAPAAPEQDSNGQIRRILGLSQYEVDALFPLSAK